MTTIEQDVATLICQADFEESDSDVAADILGWWVSLDNRRFAAGQEYDICQGIPLYWGMASDSEIGAWLATKELVRLHRLMLAELARLREDFANAGEMLSNADKNVIRLSEELAALREHNDALIAGERAADAEITRLRERATSAEAHDFMCWLMVQPKVISVGGLETIYDIHEAYIEWEAQQHTAQKEKEND